MFSIRLAAAAVTALTAAALPSPAVARSHHFAPAREVVVTLELPARVAAGRLRSFGRNPVTLTRDRHGALILRVGRRHSRRIVTPGGRAVAVRLTVSARARSARVVAGTQAAAVRGSYVAETAVTVRDGRAVVTPSKAGAGSSAAGAPAAPA